MSTDEGDDTSYEPVYRDGHVHVCAEMCSTCIFRPRNLMHLSRGRVREMIDGARADDSCIPCHHTIRGEHPDGPAVCRGFFEKHATTPLQIAERMGMIVWQDPEP